MRHLLFSGPSAITIQGARVLRFINQQSSFAQYEVIGFDGSILIRDYRSVGLKALNYMLETNQLKQFAYQFNKPSNLVIEEGNSGTLYVTLCETLISQPEHMLWIVSGLPNYLPNYDYVIDHIVPMEDDSFSLFALYRINPFHHSSSSSSLNEPKDNSLSNEIVFASSGAKA